MKNSLHIIHFEHLYNHNSLCNSLFYSVILIFRMVVEPKKIQVNSRKMQNTGKFDRNLMKYMSLQHIWNLSQLLGLSTCRKTCKFILKLCHWNVQTMSQNYNIGVDCVAKNWALAMMLKALPLVHIWSILLMKEQVMTSVRKTLKMLVWSAQNWSISSESCPKNNHKISCILLIAFHRSLPRKFPQNQ